MNTQTESKRLQLLEALQIMDTASEAVFDNLTRLASIICGTPMSTISLVDEKRQWFKSKIGMTQDETPREHAFCAHTIQDDKLLIIEDALEDERFANNPLVTGNPNVRFYAGAPLGMQGGERLGALCVIDTKPRKLTEIQLEALSVLSQAVVTQLEYRKSLRDLEDLQRIIPMCAWCRSIRIEGEEEPEWQPLHKYVESLSDVSHGICPSCKSDLQSKL